VDQPPSQASAVEFTEEMQGFVTVGESDYHAGFQRGKDAGRAARVHLTVTIDDVDRFIADPTREATVTGWVECEALGGRLPVERGIFNLFADEAEPDRTHVYYRLFLSDGAGGPLTLSGFKDVLDDPGLDRWPDTSTLYVRVFRGHTVRDGEPGAEVVAGGILHTHLADFARQLATFRARGPSSVARDRVLDDFGRLFLGKLWTVYGGQARAAAGTEGLATPSGQGAGDG
jgi:cholesterol oxidase